MVKRCAFLLAGLSLVAASTGCCCGLLHGCGYKNCNPCGPGYAAPSPCGPGGCAPSYYPPYGSGASYYQGFGSSALIADPAISAATPVLPGATTAAMPLNSLPTY
jgi:hypothetical protein